MSSKLYDFKEFLVVNDNSQHIKYEGYTGTFCKRCYSPIIFKTKYEFECTTGSNNITPSVNFDDFLAYDVKCPICKYQEYQNNIVLDPNITLEIANLNLKGYLTLKSCEGHILYGDGNGYSGSYIYFANTKYLKVFNRYPLPDEWYIDKEDLADGTLVIRGLDTDDGTRNVKIYKTEEAKVRRLDALHEWVFSLPDFK